MRGCEITAPFEREKMYPQHEKAIQNLIEKFRNDPEVLAVVSRFIEDQEEWWYRERPYIEEW